MVSFIIAIVLLVLGYLLYSKVIERVIGVDPKRVTPAVAQAFADTIADAQAVEFDQPLIIIE